MRRRGRSQFDGFYRSVEPRVRSALVACYGVTAGVDASTNAMAYAWENWDRVNTMASPVAYLYRVGQTSLRRRMTPVLFPPPPNDLPDVEPGLPAALSSLTERQRICIFLVHGMQWRISEVAELLEISESSVRNHLRRALAHLRLQLGVADAPVN